MKIMTVVALACCLVLVGCISIPIGPSTARYEKHKMEDAYTEAIYSLEELRKSVWAFPYHSRNLQEQMSIAKVTLLDIGSSSDEIERLRVSYKIAHAKHWGKLYVSEVYLLLEEPGDFEGSFQLTQLETPFTAEE